MFAEHNFFWNIKSLKMKNYWDKFAPFYNLSRRVEKKAYNQMYVLIRDTIKGKDVLELATATGIIAFNTASVANTFLATDYAEQMMKVAKKDKRWEQMKQQNIKLDFAQANATALPYSASQFDVVLIANALHIMPNPTAALKEISRVLKPDGILIAPTYVHGDNTIWQRIVAKAMALTGFKEYANWTVDSYQEFLRSNGWNIRRSTVINASFPLAYVECNYAQIF